MKTIRNEADRASLIERLNKLNGNEERIWGKMTVNQMLSHLVQACEMPFGHELKNQSNFMSRNVIKPLVLYILTMPKEVKTSPDMNQASRGEKLSKKPGLPFLHPFCDSSLKCSSSTNSRVHSSSAHFSALVGLLPRLQPHPPAMHSAIVRGRKDFGPSSLMPGTGVKIVAR